MTSAPIAEADNQPDESQNTNDPRLRKAVILWVIAISTAALAVRLFWIVERYAVNILLGDQWVFDDATLFQKHSLLQIFRWQHGPHRQGLGGILSNFIGPLIRWNSRYEAFGIALALCIAAVLALWLKQRLFGKLQYSDVIIPLFFLTLSQYEVMLGPANPSHGPLPLLLFVIYCLALTIGNPLRRYGALLLANFFLIYTGFGLFAGFITPVITFIEFTRTRKREALIATTIAVISLASFWIGYHPNPAVDCFSPRLRNPFYYGLFVAFMMSSFAGTYPSYQLVPAILLGSGLLIVVVIVSGYFFVRYFRRGGPLTTVIFALLSYSLIFSVATAYGRVCLGLGAAQGSRYMTYLILCFLGLYLAAMSARVRLERNIFVVLLLVLAVRSSMINSAEYAFIKNLSSKREAWKQCYLATGNISQCDLKTQFAICWTPEPSDLQDKLNFLQRKHWNLYADTSSPPKQP